MDYKSIKESTGLTPIHFIMNSDLTCYYKNLLNQEVISPEKVKNLDGKFCFELVFEDGKIKNTEDISVPEWVNGLALSLGNAYEKDGKEYCRAFPMMIK